ncbi:MAG: DUF2723 domain-containing protein [Chlorobium sp.]|jgi:hypothetical protein|uniref:glycosyltransferase family 117 protein n=1 Tax=Chlorobium sp. TaxID=1095 RepID=UPI001D4E94FE|nr:DUF2723 domain-containing protein [Chlorobium sp.]MBN1278467.1 DUF2723 domain-containing protein [Chlorobiaceae bacterium]MCF8215460.1 DUF2723 domain-containing protein [Chlorobium sp.]MCF8270315.1 DUF2723 domain-containing protein [Chlorobium sp.]MCF8286667.1 DUF2723 domain-containing protein [Chlorobium sp.]MCF8290360.1 DUF2723 domain-containing protein [Chlorobium sp.]
MTHRAYNRLFAVLLFVAVELLYFRTMAPTLSFWDCGEFIATAYTLGVPHPPGAPLFLLIGRLFSMMPFFDDIGARVNLMSTLASSATVMLTYLITMRFIVMYRKNDPDGWSTGERISAYGSAVIAALALAFSDSFWFNAVETEVYALSSFFTAMVVWLMLRWHDEYPDPGHERWLMLVMYMVGLSIGVHLLSLLAVFAAALVYYFRRYEVTLKSFLLLIGASSALFFLIYQGIIKGLPILFQLASWWGLLLVVAALAWGVWYTQKERFAMTNTLLVSLFLIVIGYTSYGMIYVRAQAGPPINENNPSTPEAFFSYLNREQYGEMPIWPRRWSPEPVHQYFYQQYRSDLDYFIGYQLNRMYLRYLGWQFIGREHDMEGAGVDWSVLWGLPFIAGFAGAVAHFRREWKMGLVVTALFILTGAALVVYLNQTEPQPRERDYSYAGSFFAFAIWIGIGIESFSAWLKDRFTLTKVRQEAVVSGVLIAAALLLVNGRMLQANYHMHDRSGNYVPWDWAWNMLQSCEKDAILFTNGDNDTFPLWYLQEVERIRTDVRVVNLSLANTGWYLLQLKNTSPRGAKPVIFSAADGELANITYLPLDSADVAIFAGDAGLRLASEAARGGFTLPTKPVDSLKWVLKPGFSYQGQGYLRPQDIAVYEIVTNNFPDRPVYFALTVDQESMIGLQYHLRLDGLVYKVVPLRSDDPMSFVDPVRLHGSLMDVYRFRNLNNSDVTLEETSRRLCANYMPLFVRLAINLAGSPGGSLRIGQGDESLRSVGRGELALEVLDTAARVLPPERYPVNPELAGTIVSLYSRLGSKQKAGQYISYLEKLAAGSSYQTDPRLFFMLAGAYRDAGREQDASRLIESLSRELQEPRIKEVFEQQKEQE